MTLRDELQESLGTAYVIDRELTGGGMSRVFVATEVALDRLVVVKVLHPDLAAAVTAERFAREIQLAARLQQANIVPLLTAGRTGDVPYYTMPFVAGASLRQRLTEAGGPLPIAEAVGILRDVARALSYAHAAGVAHRDIKPENVLLSHGAAMVTDFGIAKALSVALTQSTKSETLTQPGAGIGTPAYMAPEQVVGDPSVDHRADLYAFGCLAYELLTGHPPFRGKSVSELMAAHLADTPASVRAARPDVPLPLATLVERCLEKSPSNRPQSARELLDALETASTPSSERSVPALSSLRGMLAATVVITLAISGWFVVRRAVAPARINEPTVAVIPFVNVGGDSAQDYLADGVSDELATAIGRVPDVHVAARSAAYRFRGRRDVDVRELGRTLQVNFIVQGTLRRLGDQLRISAQVTDASSGRELWSDTFDRTTKDVFRTQDEISGAIAAAIVRRVKGDQAPAVVMRGVARQGTQDADAYDLYLRGEFLLRRRQVQASSAMFEQAIARDARFARAYAGLSQALALSPYYSMTAADEVYDRVRTVARQALALDSTLAEAHMAIAIADLNAWRWDAAHNEFERAVTIDPTDAQSHFQYGRYWWYMRQDDRALAEWQRALQVDPFSALAAAWTAQGQLAHGQLADAVQSADRAVQWDSSAAIVKQIASLVAQAANNRAKSLALADRLPDNPPWIAMYVSLHAAVGDSTPARALLRRLDAPDASLFLKHTMRAYAALTLREDDRAMAELVAATDAHEIWPTYNRVQDPMFNTLRGRAEWAALLRRVGLANVPGAVR